MSWAAAKGLAIQSPATETSSRDMQCHLSGKKPALLSEAEKFRLDIVRLAPTHSLGFGTKLLESGWSFFHSAVAYGERCRAGVGILIAPRLGTRTLGFTLVDERVAYLHVRMGDWSWQQLSASTSFLWCLWRVCSRVVSLGTPSFCSETEVLTRAMTLCVYVGKCQLK